MGIEGVFSINKPRGISSQRAVQIVKYWARRKTGDKNIKVGHAGTLDPLATGVLVIAVGREHTAKIDTFVSAQKEYIGEVFLGKISTTDDAEGEKENVNVDRKPSREEVEKAVQSFVGDIAQTPPAYSAIKIDGQEAYKRVRRGEDVAMESRTVRIDAIEIISYKYPMIKIRVTCGKGTYIRSLARDIGEELKTGAYLASLERTRVGEFTLDRARDLDDFRARIAVHAQELDGERIDGTRVYVREMLARFGALAQDDRFLIYHQGDFNKELAPPERDNYHERILKRRPMWTQTRFALDLLRQKPDVLWMPVHNMPLIRSKKTKAVVTIHDLAFKIYPETFPRADRKKLNALTKHAVRKADHIIAVSQATKDDIVRFFPRVKEDKITVVHHGIDCEFWQKESSPERVLQILHLYGADAGQYLIHVGAIQPRKNLNMLIDAFGDVKKKYPDMKLVLAGGRGWLWQEIEDYAKKNLHSSDIIFTGNIPFEHVRILMQNARMFVFPSLYEGFGLPGLEAMAANVPVVAAKNSSISEVLGSAVEYFDAQNSDDCTHAVLSVLGNEELQEQMRARGLKHAQKFTWEKCAKKTLAVLRR